MFKRTLVLIAAFLVLIAAVVINLAILNIIPMEELRESLRQLISVAAVSAVAVVLIQKLLRLAAPKASEDDGSPAPGSGPPAKGEKTGLNRD